MVGILYYPPERNPRHPHLSWMTPEQAIFTTTDKPVETVADVRPALRGIGFVPKDIDYDLYFMTRDIKWVPETEASRNNIVAYMRPTREVMPSSHLLESQHYNTITLRLRSYGRNIDIGTFDDSDHRAFVYHNDREQCCIIS